MQTFPEDPYYQGRWSNGPTWIEIVASSLGVSLTDYGAGGATTGSAPARMCQPSILALLLMKTSPLCIAMPLHVETRCMG